MKTKKILSLLLSFVMLFSTVPFTTYAGDASSVVSAEVHMTAQANGAFLCAPQMNVSVSSDTAEKYGFKDSVTNGVSAADALVKLHEIKYGTSFTKATAANYLAYSDDGYLSKLFGVETIANGFVYNGAYPNDGTKSEFGGYNGTTVTTQKLSDDDTVAFFLYQDTSDYSDELAWFQYKGNAVTEITALPATALKLNLRSSSYMMAYEYKDADALHAVGTSVSGAQLAYVNSADGQLTKIANAVTDASGNVTLSAPAEEGIYYLTAYIPEGTDGEPLILSLTKMIVDKNAPQEDPCALSALSVASFDSNPNALPLTPAFEQKITEYSVPLINYPDMDLAPFRSIYVKAAASSDEALITAECNGVKAEITSGDSQWSRLNGALTGGKNNVLKITVAASDDENAEKKTYSVIAPMKPQTNTAPVASKETDESTITLGESYSVDLSTIFSDADEVDTLSYQVSINQEDPVAAQQNYLFTPTASGKYTLRFTANDGTTDSNAYQVNLTVRDNNTQPYFESLEFLTSSLVSGTWVKGKTFSPTTLTYQLPIKNATTSSLMLQSATAYDTDQYTAIAEYTDESGVKQSVPVNSGKMTTFANQPFDDSVLTITLADKNNPENKTVYTFYVSRPRDTTKTVKKNGISLSLPDRALSATAYKGLKEGTMQRADENGSLTSGTGVDTKQYYYRTFIYDDTGRFQLNVASSTTHAHIRYRANGDAVWTEIPQGGGNTNAIAFPESGSSEVTIQVLDDKTYTENQKAGKDAFAESEPTEYKVWVDKVALSKPELLTALTSDGDWYPAFQSDRYSYWIVLANKAEAPVLHYTATEGSKVTIGKEEQVADENGKYSLTLGKTQSSITVTSSDGNYTTVYQFGYRQKSALDVPDRVVDYLCIGSQYTNGVPYGANPEVTLSGTLKSLGNFGGYITYYYENPIIDNPNNKYGMDFYITGNPFSESDSAAEPGQVYVSEDGETWYALAGSDHYESTALWDYTITYTKGADGKSYWTDNYGNVMNYAAKLWPSAEYYYMNDVSQKEQYTFQGVLLKSQLGSIMGDGTTGAFAARPKFGYTDCYISNVAGTKLTDVNSYVEKPSKANGFDVAWAVDEKGIPVDVSNKAFHYIKVATASNISAGAFGEKSTEVSYVVRTAAQEEAVGKTTAPAGVTISDGATVKTVNFEENQTVYSVNLDNMKYVSVKVNGTADDDNIYINNQRVASGVAAEGFKVTKENGETLVRVIVQNGEKEPVLYLLKLTSSAEESNELIEAVKIDAKGTVRLAGTKNGTDYTANVGHRIDSVSITPVAAQNVSLTINGKEIAETYDLDYGSNVFELIAEGANGNFQKITLTVTRDEAPASTGKTITVSFMLYGDERHGDAQVHTYRKDKNKLPVWIPRKSYTLDSGAMLVDLFEKALTEANLTWKNESGNYVSEINGLAEFDNGTPSGWMYLLNGKHPNLGVAEQSLKNGDVIVFHYTDDYKQEEGSERWNSSSSGGNAASCTIRFETNGGSTLNSQTVNKNGTVVKPADPTKEGYTFGGWYSDSALTQEYDFRTKVTGNVTLYAKWIKESENPEDPGKTSAFTDVEKGSWYEKAVAYVTENHLFQGVSETEFAPHAEMTRAMLVTVLYRLEKAENKSAESKFSDVVKGEWYENAVIWAAENGIVSGISETEFAPEDTITREQLATILYRYAKQKGYNTENTAEITRFTDVNEVSDWAMAALQWANAAELVKGTGDTTLSPLETATRAQVAVILMRFCESLAK